MGLETILGLVIAAAVSEGVLWFKEWIHSKHKGKVIDKITTTIENDLTTEQSKAVKEAVAKNMIAGGEKLAIKFGKYIETKFPK